uniref:Uncharacterized protein n=1 Tax=Panagrolaimus sp. PS1159 TaxID=55785 RepID=A0AC35EZ82_9BILA
MLSYRNSASLASIKGPQEPACKNNGTFVITGPNSFICKCPENTFGADCSVILTCEVGNCGSNATCTIFNNKKICTCLPGYTGNPNVACNIRTKTACVSGDPHYTTFDGAVFDYMGTCPYYLMKPCNSNSFSVIATNALLPNNPSVSTLKEFTLKIQGHEFKVNFNLQLFVDGINSNYPYYWPSKVNPKIIATKPTNAVYIHDNFTGAVFTYYQHFLCAEIPEFPSSFYGNDTMCGLWGNGNNICTDDIQAQNGVNFSVPSSCIVHTNLSATYLMDTWVANNVVDSCIPGGSLLTNTICNTTLAQTQCDLILQAIINTGPFAACSGMNRKVLEARYHDCTYDICSGMSRCDALNDFAHHCTVAIPFVNIAGWRSISNCSFPKCPPHSKYSMKTPKCQKSCSDLNYDRSSSCQDGYEEGCICDANYFYDANGDNTTEFQFMCRLQADCGCVDPNGNYHRPNEYKLQNNCTLATTCINGSLTSEPHACSINGQCAIINGSPTCQCRSGYIGDGYNCTDINECLNPNMCGANLGQGICTDLPGAYECTCYSPYSGLQCENYTPSRHCADLQLFHGVTENGTYSISIDANYNSNMTDEDLTWIEVFCDMESNGGGWTLMAHGNESGGKTFNDYVNGFGDPISLNVWLGLENIHSMTTTTPTSLRVVLEQCATETYPDETEECIYPFFKVSDLKTQYSVFINSSSTCNGTTSESQKRFDGWISWNPSKIGPKFSTFDKKHEYNCSSKYFNTGWWYYKNGNNLCGNANLNGLRYPCGRNVGQDMYLTWNRNPIADAYMYLRPYGFPNYDYHYTNDPAAQLLLMNK